MPASLSYILRCYMIIVILDDIGAMMSSKKKGKKSTVDAFPGKKKKANKHDLSSLFVAAEEVRNNIAISLLYDNNSND